MSYWVYILYSKKFDRFYTGCTSNFEERMDFHYSSLPQKFTGKSDDWQVYFKFKCSTKRQAFRVENHIKGMKSRKYFQNLKQYPEMVDALKSKYSDC